MQYKVRQSPAWPLVIFLLLPPLARAETAVQAWVQTYRGPGNASAYPTALTLDSSNNIIVSAWANVASGNFFTIKYSSAGVPIWTNRYNDGSYAYALAADGSNNVIVTGISMGSFWDYATIKYSSDGVPLWTNGYNGPGNSEDRAKAVAVDSYNNVIVTGYSDGYPVPNLDYATIKYSSAGVPLWTNRYNGPGAYEYATALAVDGSDGVVVTGYSGVSENSSDYATIKYSSAGVPLWTNRYNGPGNRQDQAQAIAVDGGGDVIVTGFTTVSGSFADYTTIKYSGAGVPLWTNHYDGPGHGDDRAVAMAVDGNTNVIVAGYSRGSGSSYDDYATIKYSSAGIPLWTNRYNGPGNYDDRAVAVAVDASNNVIVTGYSASTNLFQSYNYDYATIKYSSAGLPLWTNRYNSSGGGDDYARRLAVDHSGNVIVTGGSPFDADTVKYICVPEPIMTPLQPTNGAFQMRVDDVLQPGTLVIEAATNLVGWAPVFTNSTPTNALFYTDPDASNAPTRFYRAYQFP